ncbi:MAG: NADH-quinone oxidoreductase subunit [Frankiaceae bacterium]|jgi:NADH-quinone oxidoreductase subunit J|nr:NADH-quinone oxidoreductase subunit [Frankiaceae bacterium]
MTSPEQVLFWVLGPLSVLSALGMVLARKAVHSALFLAFDMLCLAAFYAAEQAPFLAFVQVVVYTGAVMMLFLFVLMLVGVDASDSLIETLRGHRFAALSAGLGFAIVLCSALGGALGDQAVVGLETPQANGSDNVYGVAKLIFTRYLFAFEVTGALLITAALAAMVLAHRERTTPKVTQREMALARFRGNRPSPLPGPGVFARHNAVDTPALLPDGSPAPGSVPTSIAEDMRRDHPPLPASVMVEEGEL